MTLNLPLSAVEEASKKFKEGSEYTVFVAADPSLDRPAEYSILGMVSLILELQLN